MFDAVVLGSGVSTGVPMISHVLQGRCPDGGGTRRKDGVPVCEEALLQPNSKNRRFNVSLLVRYRPPDGDQARHIMVDAGKTMRQAVLAAFPDLGAKSIDALLLTHGHADAILGMDDLRDLQVIERLEEEGQLIGYQPAAGSGPLRIISNRDTLDRVREVFPYLCGPADLVRPGVLRRRVAYLELQEAASDNDEIEVAGLNVRLFPVWHGGTYVSLGFAFGCKRAADGDVVGYPLIYISDVKEVPPETMAWLESVAKVGIEVLMVDALSVKGHTTHFSLSDALDFARRLQPKKTLLVGIASCELGDHDEVNAELAKTAGFDVQLAYDGLVLDPFPAESRAQGSG